MAHMDSVGELGKNAKAQNNFFLNCQILSSCLHRLDCLMKADTAHATLTFGSIVRAERVKKRISLRELARRLEISPTYLSHIEVDRVPPPMADKVTKLASELNLDASHLMKSAGRWDEHAAEAISARPVLRELFTLAFAMDEDELLQFVESLEERLERKHEGETLL